MIEILSEEDLKRGYLRGKINEIITYLNATPPAECLCLPNKVYKDCPVHKPISGIYEFIEEWNRDKNICWAGNMKDLAYALKAFLKEKIDTQANIDGWINKGSLKRELGI